MTAALQDAKGVDGRTRTTDPDSATARHGTPPDECIHCTRRRTAEHDPDTCARCALPHNPQRSGNWTGPIRHKCDPRIVW